MGAAKKLMIALVLILLPLMSIHGVEASEGSSSVTVSYTPDRIYAYVSLKVEATGNGEVLDMGQPIRSGSVTFDMQEGDARKFEIRPDEGYVIRSVEYHNGYEAQELSTQLKDHTVSIMLKDRDAVLKVRFEKKTDPGSDHGRPNGNGTGSGNSSTIQQGVQTGDVTRMELVLMLMGIALILMLIIWKRSKESDESDIPEAGNIDEGK